MLLCWKNSGGPLLTNITWKLLEEKMDCVREAEMSGWAEWEDSLGDAPRGRVCGTVPSVHWGVRGGSDTSTVRLLLPEIGSSAREWQLFRGPWINSSKLHREGERGGGAGEDREREQVGERDQNVLVSGQWWPNIVYVFFVWARFENWNYFTFELKTLRSANSQYQCWPKLKNGCYECQSFY